MLGFETIGNATLILYDGEPLLATDPWIHGNAYFGSWGRPYEIPPEQLDAIKRAKYIWFSHAHPDHLNAESLELLQDKEILLADHVGRRIETDLRNLGHNVRTLPDRGWFPLTGRVKVLTIADYNQDSILLADVNGKLVINLNDTSDRGWRQTVKNISDGYKDSYVMRITGWDGDMINLFAPDGSRIPHRRADKKPLGWRLAAFGQRYSARYVIPFSSFHRYEREDSIWASEYTAPVEALGDGFESDVCELLPAFVRVDCENGGEPTPLNPKPNPRKVYKPEEFGDSWSDVLSNEDQAKIAAYVKKKERIRKYFGFVGFRVGGRDFNIDLEGDRKIGITFEAPRNSLMTAVEYEVFDDMLLGNFMKTTLHGFSALNKKFSPIVAKYADNGLAQSEKQIRRYFWEYFKRSPLDMLIHIVESKAEDRFRNMANTAAPGSPLQKHARAAFSSFHRR